VKWADLHNRNDLMIVDGERRWRGAKGVQETIPAMIRRDQEDDVERLRTQLVANTGKPLTPIEEARAFAQLIERTGMSHEELAKFLGRPRSTISERLRVLETGPWVALVESGELPISHVVQHVLPYASIPDKHHDARHRADEEGLPVLAERCPSRRRARSRRTTSGASSSSSIRPLLYPLTRTKTSYAKQPEFDTRDHEQECTCGVIRRWVRETRSARAAGTPTTGALATGRRSRRRRRRRRRARAGTATVAA
jgi:hypothetical protein